MTGKTASFLFLKKEPRETFLAAFRTAEKIDDLSKWELVLRPAKSKRSLEQNAKMWAMLSDLSSQLRWPVDGVVQKITPEEWKDILTAGLKQELRVAAGMAGGIVLLGRHTRNMSIQEMTDLIELMTAFGTEHGVRFTFPENQVFM